MSISKKSIIAGLGLALSLASGLAQAGQECIKGVGYNPAAVKCDFTLNSVPGKKTIVINIDAWLDDIRQPIEITPAMYTDLFRGQTIVKSWRGEQFVGGPGRYTFNKEYSYKKGTLGQFNYTLKVQMTGSSRAAGTLKVTTNR